MDKPLKMVRTITVWYTVDRSDYPGMTDEEIVAYETDNMTNVGILRIADATEETTEIDPDNA